MLRHRHKREAAGIDVTAFADIAFLLIIFFILTTTFVRTAGTRMDIPAGQEDQQQADRKNLTVSLTATDIRYGETGESVDMQRFRDRLAREEFAERPEDDRIVILDSAPDVPYQRYFEVVVAITQADGVLALVEAEEDRQ